MKFDIRTHYKVYTINSNHITMAKLIQGGGGGGGRGRILFMKNDLSSEEN